MGTMRSLPRRASALLSGLEENLVVSSQSFHVFWDDMG